MTQWNAERWHKERKKSRIVAIVLGAIALINAADFQYPLPIPLVGLTAIVATAVLAIIAYCYYTKGWDPPSDHIIFLIAEKYGGQLTLAVLEKELMMSIEKTEGILLDLWEKKVIHPFVRAEEGTPPEETPISQLGFKWYGIPEKRKAGPQGAASADSHETSQQPQPPQPQPAPPASDDVPVGDIDAINRALLGNTLTVQGGLPFGRR